MPSYNNHFPYSRTSISIMSAEVLPMVNTVSAMVSSLLIFMIGLGLGYMGTSNNFPYANIVIIVENPFKTIAK